MDNISIKLNMLLISSKGLDLLIVKLLIVLSRRMSKLRATDGELLLDATLYTQLVESLIYLIVTRSNLAYAVHLVSQFMIPPRSVGYLRGTLFHGLHLSSYSSLDLHVYSDAD
jgi:hypothetical protein